MSKKNEETKKTEFFKKIFCPKRSKCTDYYFNCSYYCTAYPA